MQRYLWIRVFDAMNQCHRCNAESSRFTACHQGSASHYAPYLSLRRKSRHDPRIICRPYSAAAVTILDADIIPISRRGILGGDREYSKVRHTRLKDTKGPKPNDGHEQTWRMHFRPAMKLQSICATVWWT